MLPNRGFFLTAHAAFSLLLGACLGLSAASAQRPAVSLGHSGRIRQVIPAPDGKRLFTTDDELLKVWDIESGKEIQTVDRGDDGGPYGQKGPWSIEFDAKDGSLLTARGRRMVARGSGSFSHRYSVRHPNDDTYFNGAWDETRQRYYVFTRTSSNFIDCYTYIPFKGDWKLVDLRLLSPSFNKIGVDVHSVVILPNNKVWVGTTGGSLVFDAERLENVFEHPGDKRRLYEGEGERIYALRGTSTEFNYPGHTLERIDPQSMQVVASYKHPKEQLTFSGRHAFDPKRRLIWVTAGNQLIGLDPDTLEKRTERLLRDVTHFEFLARIPGTEDDWAATDGTRVFTLEMEYSNILTEFEADPFLPTRIAATPGGNGLIISDPYSASKFVRFGPKGPEVTHIPSVFSTIAFHPTTFQVAFTQSDHSVRFTDAASVRNLRLDVSADGQAPRASHLVYSPDGSLIVLTHPDGFSVLNTSNKQEIYRQEVAVDSKARYRPIAISDDNRTVIVSVADSRLAAFDIGAKRQLWNIQAKDGFGTSRRDMLFFAAADLFACIDDRKLEYRSVADGSLLFDVQIPANLNQSQAAAMSPDQRYVAIGQNLLVHVIDAEVGETVFHQGVAWADVTSIEFLNDSRHLAVGSKDGLLRIWDIKAKKSVLSLALFGKSEEWVAIGPDFRFDASQSAMNSVYLVRGDAVLPVDALFEKLYTPKLTARILAGEEIPPPDLQIETLQPAPTIRMELADGTRNLTVEDDVPDNQTDRETINVRVTADAGAAELEELRLYHNGKLLRTTAGQGHKSTQSFEVTLTPGDNLIRAIALNTERTESRPAELSLVYKPKLEPIVGREPTQGGGLQLHLLVVGVNTYANPKYNLNYAVADATAVRELVEKQNRTVFTRSNVKFILDRNANKSAIVEAFRTMASGAGKRDVFVFYYAGHGVMTQEAKPEFFLVPHDVTQLYGADDALRQKGISAAELQELAKTMPAQKQLFILDACQSAGALTTVAMRGAAEEKAIAQLARSTGTHWLTASGSEQFATEFEQLGHGAFTYVLLDALNGKADTGDGRVTVNELKAYLEAQVPEVTQKYKGTPQFPSSYGFGQDFPVAVVGD